MHVGGGLWVFDPERKGNHFHVDHFHVEPTDVAMLDVMESTSSIADDAGKNFETLVTRILAGKLFCLPQNLDSATGTVSPCAGVPEVVYLLVHGPGKALSWMLKLRSNENRIISSLRIAFKLLGREDPSTCLACSGNA